MNYRETKHSMLRRCYGWDYRSPSIYMITFSLANRREHLLGELCIQKPKQNPPLPQYVKAEIIPSQLGGAVLDIWKKFPATVPEIKPMLLQLMPEHLHGILHVTRQLSKHLGQAIASFKAACSKVYWELFPDRKTEPLFESGYQDSILLHQGQLNNMINYALDNPRRLAVKMLFPDLFQHQRLIPFANATFSGIGNHFLLNYPMLRQVQISRNEFGTASFLQKKRDLLTSIRYGTALVSPCISDGERDIAFTALERNIPLIVLKHSAFPEHYKPSGKYFDACAAGRLLMIVPSAWQNTHAPMGLTREKACILNALAQKICGDSACEISYNGIVPMNIEMLIQQATQPFHGRDGIYNKV